MKRVVVTVINDLVTDQRVHRVCTSIQALNADVLLIGRSRKKSLELSPRPYQTCRMSLPFETGPLFYATFNIHLFFKLLFAKCHLIYCNDLDTLPAGYLASRIKSIPLIYDSHEYFTEVPELINNPKVRKFWLKIEQFLFPKPNLVISVNQSLAEEYSKIYHREVFPIRNLPFKKNKVDGRIHEEFHIVSDKKIIVYQGAVNKHRGLEEAIEAMKYLKSDAVLVIIGDGDILQDLKTKVIAENLIPKVIFTGAIPYSNLHQYTCSASLGISIELPSNDNYIFSLPNKIFDYIQAQVPILTTNFPETSQIVQKYHIGKALENHDPQHIAQTIDEMLTNSALRNEYNIGLELAANELCWENEQLIFNKIVSKYVE